MKLLKLVLTLGIVIISFCSQAEVEKKTFDNNLTEEKSLQEKVGDAYDSSKNYLIKASENIQANINAARDERESSKYIALLNYSIIDLMIPGKIGLTLGYNESADKTYELEYLKGSLAVPFFIKDLGSVTDQRISFISRSFGSNNSFNVSYGLSYFGFNVTAGNDILNRASAGAVPHMPLLDIKALGAQIAIGNRWAYKNKITWGVDWLSWAQPLFVLSKSNDFAQNTNNQSDIDDINKVISTVSYFPRFTLLKLQFGMQF